jgi:hypothetical protein
VNAVSIPPFRSPKKGTLRALVTCPTAA